MKPLALLWLLLAVGCVHATTTRAADPKPAPPVRAETITTSRTTKQMFKPEGLKKLQAALSSKATQVDASGQLDAQTQEALRVYQRAQKLPSTGLPDYETVRRLGLKPDEVFHRAPSAERVGVQ